MAENTQDLLVVEQEDQPARLLPNEEQIKSLAEKIDLLDPSLTVTYGSDTMTDIAHFADELLSTVRAKDAGAIGGTLTDLMVKVKSFDINHLHKKSFLARLPLIGGLFDRTQRVLASIKTVADQVETVSEKLDDTIVELIKDISMLEQLYSYNLGYYDNLNLYIAAGEQRLEKARNEELPALRERAQDSQDSMAAQRVRDMADAITRFERRLHDLKLSKAVAMQTAPQIRLIQNNNKTLAEKIQTSILSTIPLWKSQVVLALTLQRQQSAAALQKEISDTTNDLLKRNAELLEDNTIATAKEMERPVVDVAGIKDVQKRLIHSIEETLSIAREGRSRRQKTEKELLAMENEMKKKMVSLAGVKEKDMLEAAQGQTGIDHDSQP